MEPKKFHKRGQAGPEAEIQKRLVKYLEARSWLVKQTHGNLFQSGLPDLYCVHGQYGQRWIEVKNPKAYVFTPAQRDFFPKLNAVGIGIWILTDANEYEYQKLFAPANWHYFL